MTEPADHVAHAWIHKAMRPVQQVALKLGVFVIVASGSNALFDVETRPTSIRKRTTEMFGRTVTLHVKTGQTTFIDLSAGRIAQIPDGRP